MAVKKDRQLKRKDDGIDMGFMYGFVPPQAKDMEEAVLGAIMLEKNIIDLISDFMTPQVFYVEAHQHIFQSMLQLSHKSQPIDILTVTEELKRMEALDMVGGPYYIHRLTNSVVRGTNLEAHSRIIYQKFLQREMIRLGGQMIRDGYQDGSDVFVMLDEAEEGLFKISNDIFKKAYTGVDSLIVKEIQAINNIRLNQQEISGVTSGFPSLDRLTHGWQNTDLIVLAARPGVGKTALALQLARNAAMAGKPTGFMSLEMSSGQLIRRMLSCETEISLERINRGRLEESDMKDMYQKGVQKLAQSPLFIDDTAGMNIFELRAKARRLKAKHNLSLLIIDYLQLMAGTDESRSRNREQEISEISRNLKKLAKELNIPIIALSQLSRETEKRNDKTPQLSDLRESGAIEQDADAVVFIYRPEYYGLHKDAAGESNPGETHLKFAKYRNGTPGTVKLRAKLWIQKFEDMEQEVVKQKDGVTQQWKQVQSQVDFTDKTFSNNKT